MSMSRVRYGPLLQTGTARFRRPFFPPVGRGSGRGNLRGRADRHRASVIGVGTAPRQLRRTGRRVEERWRAGGRVQYPSGNDAARAPQVPRSGVRATRGRLRRVRVGGGESENQARAIFYTCTLHVGVLCMCSYHFCGGACSVGQPRIFNTGHAPDRSLSTETLHVFVIFKSVHTAPPTPCCVSAWSRCQRRWPVSDVGALPTRGRFTRCFRCRRQSGSAYAYPAGSHGIEML